MCFYDKTEYTQKIRIIKDFFAFNLLIPGGVKINLDKQ